MQEISVGLSIVGILVLLGGFLSVSIERFPLLSRPMIALGFGFVFGPTGWGILVPEHWSGHPEKVLEFATELTICIALMGVALRLPPRFFSQNRRSLLVILGLGMPLMWISASAVIGWTLGLPLGIALLAGAVLTPTDPVLSTTIVHGKVAEENLPLRLRHLISAEAGANDGLALPFVFLPMLILTHGGSDGVREWLIDAVLTKTLGAIVLGAALGVATGRLLEIAEKKKTMEEASILVTTLALTILALGVSKLVGVNGILAVFVAGLAFDCSVDTEERATEEKTQEAVNQFFTVPIFFLLGLYAPVRDWIQLGGAGAAMVAGILLLRRLPAVLAIGSWIPSLRNGMETAITGWFGPMGAAAMYYGLSAKAQTGHGEIWTIASLVVCASVVVHGITGTPLSRLLEKDEEPQEQET